jgi:hypothetical protein
METFKPETLGDSVDFPALKSLAEILNEREDGDRYKKSVSSLVNDMHSLYRSLNSLDKDSRRYFHLLLRNDILRRMEERNFPSPIRTHLRNYIVGFHRRKNELLKR